VPTLDSGALSTLTAKATDSLAAVNSADCTKGDITKCRTDFAALDAKMRYIKKHYFLKPPLTDADFTRLGLPIPDTTSTPHPSPSITPEIDAMPSGRRQHTVTAINPETKTKKRPELVRGVAFAHRLRQPDEPKSNAEEMPSIFQTATVRDFKWKEADVGKVADYAVVYEKEGGGRGDWSNVASVIVA
jgi:hypothetical protein